MLSVEIVLDGIEYGASHRVVGSFQDKARQRLVESYLDLIILDFLRKRGMSKYDLLEVTHRKFGVKLSQESIVSTINTLALKSLISPKISAGRMIYSLTQQGFIYTHFLSNTSEGNYAKLRASSRDLNVPELQVIQK